MTLGPRTTEERIGAVEAHVEQLETYMREDSRINFVQSLAIIILAIDICYIAWKMKAVIV
jgi:hypothetical protein